MPLKDYHNTNDDAVQLLFTSTWEAQTFTASSGYDISSVKLKLYKLSSPGTVTVSIKATTAGKPSGPDLASGTTAGNTLTSSSPGEWREITFAVPYTIVSGTVYAIVVRSAALGIYWRSDSTFPAYAGGSRIYSSNSGSSWTIDTSDDFMFETWESASPPGKAQNPTPTDDQEDIEITGTDQLKKLQWEAPA